MPKAAKLGELSSGSGNTGANLNALAALDLYDTGLGDTLVRSCYLIDVTGYVQYLSGQAGDLVYLGISTTQLGDANIEEYIELQGPDSPLDHSEQEILSRGRIVRPLAAFDYSLTRVVFFNKTKVGIMVDEGGRPTI